MNLNSHQIKEKIISQSTRVHHWLRMKLFNKWLFHSKCFLNCAAVISQGDVKTGKYDNSNWKVHGRMREGHDKLFQRDILSFLNSRVEQVLIFNPLSEYIKFGEISTNINSFLSLKGGKDVQINFSSDTVLPMNF